MSKILVVDDSMTAREILVRVLGTGHEILTAGNGKEALAKIAENPEGTLNAIKLIFLDLLMPVMDGFEVLQSLKASSCGIPVVVISADIQKSTRSRVLDLGARALINKPVNSEIIQALISDILESGRGGHDGK